MCSLASQWLIRIYVSYRIAWCTSPTTDGRNMLCLSATLLYQTNVTGLNRLSWFTATIVPTANQRRSWSKKINHLERVLLSFKIQQLIISIFSQCRFRASVSSMLHCNSKWTCNKEAWCDEMDTDTLKRWRHTVLFCNSSLLLLLWINQKQGTPLLWVY